MDDVATVHFFGAGFHATRVTAMIRLGQPKTADEFSAGEFGQVFFLLFFRTIGIDRMHHQRALHAHGAAIAAVHTFHFAGDQAIGDIVQACAAIFFGDGRAEKTHAAHLGHDLAVEDLVAVRFEDARHELILTIPPSRITDHALFVGKLVVEKKGIIPFESLFGHRSLWKQESRGE